MTEPTENRREIALHEIDEFIKNEQTPVELKETASCLRFLNNLEYTGEKDHIKLDPIEYSFIRSGDMEIDSASPETFIDILMERSLSTLRTLNHVRTKILKNDLTYLNPSIDHLIDHRAICDLWLTFSVLAFPGRYGYSLEGKYLSPEDGYYFINSIGNIYESFILLTERIRTAEEAVQGRNNETWINDNLRNVFIFGLPLQMFFGNLASLEIMRRNRVTRENRDNTSINPSIWDSVYMYVTRRAFGGIYFEWPKEE